MVTDSLIRKKFVRDTLQQGISKIYATQESVVRSNYQLQSGRLQTSLSLSILTVPVLQGSLILSLFEFCLISVF